jgi:hypothetical protein
MEQKRFPLMSELFATIRDGDRLAITGRAMAAGFLR